MNNVDDPQLIPDITDFFVERISFSGCSTDNLILTKPVKTKQLVFMGYFQHMIFRIKWEMFPELETIVLNVHDILDTNFEKLTNLKTLFINTFTGEYRKNPSDKEVRYIPKPQGRAPQEDGIGIPMVEHLVAVV
jgi:hypothetical protein